MKAVKILGADKAEIQDVPIPEPGENEVLVKVGYVALNPIDWYRSRLWTSISQANLVRRKLNLAYMPVAGSTFGNDFYGTVSKLGPSLKKSWSVGDRILGWVVGNNVVRKDNGAFAEYCVAHAEISIRVPNSMSDEDAASPPAGITTAGFGLFQKLGLALPGEATNNAESVCGILDCSVKSCRFEPC